MKCFKDQPIQIKILTIIVSAVALSYVLFNAVGFITLRGHVEYDSLKHYLIINSLLTLPLAGLISGYLYLLLKRSVADPIARLNHLLKDIEVNKVSPLRASYYGDDEVGELAAAINYLLSHTDAEEQKNHKLVLELQKTSVELEERAIYFEEQTKSVQQLFTGASHDLRQPLQAMAIFIATLKEQSSDEQLVLVNKLDAAVENLNYMFTDILDVSTIESRIEKVSFAPVALRPMLGRVSSEFIALAQEQGLSLRFHIRDIEVESNDTLLERMVRNLLSNAIRYTQQGGVLVSARIKSNEAVIEIWDTGPGIPEAQRKAIFEQFVQLDKHSSEAQQGFGLGLSIVKRLNALLAHRISFDSKEGQGTVFRITLPLYHQRKRRHHRLFSPKPTALNVDAYDSLKAMAIEGLTAIVVDDEASIRDGLTALLASWGMQVISFASVSAIWDYYVDKSAAKADIIISDFQLSRTEDAFDAIAILRANHVSPVPAIIISGTDDQGTINAIKDSEYLFLKKPVVPAKLRALMQYALNQASVN